MSLCQIRLCKTPYLALRDRHKILHRPHHHSPGTRQSADSLVCCSRNSTMDATSCRESRSATSALATASSANDCAPVDAAFMVATCLSRTTSSGRGNFSLRGNYIFRGNDACDHKACTSTAPATNAARVITGFSGGTNFGQGR